MEFLVGKTHAQFQWPVFVVISNYDYYSKKINLTVKIVVNKKQV